MEYTIGKMKNGKATYADDIAVEVRKNLGHENIPAE